MYKYITLVSINKTVIFKNDCIEKISLGKNYNETHQLNPDGGNENGNRKKE